MPAGVRPQRLSRLACFGFGRFHNTELFGSAVSIPETPSKVVPPSFPAFVEHFTPPSFLSELESELSKYAKRVLGCKPGAYLSSRNR